MSVEKGVRMKKRDLIGLRSGRLEVVAYDEWKHGRPYLLCRCDCGNMISVRDDAIISGRTKSCGCYQRERASECAKEYMRLHPRATQNNESRDRLHNIWYLMKYRCENPKSPAYDNYMGRGIKVCSEWDDDDVGYFAFKEWALSHGYADDLMIDRIDNDGDYEPENCRWTDAVVQANNKRDNILLTYDGVTMTAAQWAREIGMPYKSFMNRIYLGWDVNKIIEQPMRKSPSSAANKTVS